MEPFTETSNHSDSREIAEIHGNVRFSTVFTRFCHWSLSWSRCISSCSSV